MKSFFAVLLLFIIAVGTAQALASDRTNLLASCNYFPGRNYTSLGIIRTVQGVPTSYGCCQHCTQEPNGLCQAATYNDNTYECVLVVDKSKFVDNVDGLTGVLNTEAPTPTTLQPTPAPTPAPTTPFGQIGLVTACQTTASFNCSILRDHSCVTFASYCGRCFNGLPWDCVYCPPMNRYSNAMMSYKYKCEAEAALLSVELYALQNCNAYVPMATVGITTGKCSYTLGQGSTLSAIVSDNPQGTNAYITASQCQTSAKCLSGCTSNLYQSTVCTRTGSTSSFQANYYEAQSIVTFAHFSDSATCERSGRMQMTAQPANVCFYNMSFVGFQNSVKEG